jgi:predicted Zn-dependent protease
VPTPLPGGQDTLAALEAEVFRRLGAHEEAADLAQVSLALDPNAAEPRLTLARALAALGRIDAAIAALAAPDPTRLYEAEQRALATLRAELEQRRAELLRAEAAAASGGGDPALVLDAAAARLAGGDRAGAVALARAVLPQLGADPALVRRAALVLGRAGRWLEAEPLWEGLTRAAAAGARDWFNLGLTREQTGDPAGAGAAYREALQAPDAVTVAADLQAGLARLAWSAGDVPTTIAALEAYLAADPPADQAARTREVLRRLRPAPEAAR